MKDVLKAAKSLSDKDLKKLIKSLESILDKRNKKRLQDAYALEERQRSAEKVKQEIEKIALNKGITLEQLGYSLEPDALGESTIKRRPSKMNAERQSFYIDETGRPQLLFTRQIKQYKAEGLALKFSELTSEQQALARALVDARNAKT